MLQVQPLLVHLMLSQTSPLLRSIPSSVIALPCPVVLKLYGLLLLKIFALMHLLSQLTLSPCPLVQMSSLLKRLSPCPVELLPSPLATFMGYRLTPLSMLAVKGIASLRIGPPMCPMVPLNPMHWAIVHPAHPTGPSFLNFPSLVIHYCQQRTICYVSLLLTHGVLYREQSCTPSGFVLI